MNDNLSLSISLTKGDRPAQYFVSITESDEPPIETSGEFAFRTPGLIKELQGLERAQFLTSVGAKSQTLALGRRLFNFAFPKTIAGAYYSLRRSLIPNKQTLKLILRIDPERSPELLDLPWEIIHDGDQFLSLDESITIIRSLPVNAEFSYADRLAPELKIVVVISSPSNLPDTEVLDVDHEADIFLQFLKTSANQQQPSVFFVEPAHADNIRKAVIETGAQILHFVGHGYYHRTRRETGLVLEDSDGLAVSYPSDKVAELLKDLPSLRLVTLNACNTAATSPIEDHSALAWQLVRNGTPAVLGMRTSVSDNTAILFSRVFYHELGRAVSIDSATAAARRALASSSQDPDAAFAVPVLVQSTTKSITLSENLFSSKVSTLPENRVARPRQREAIELRREIESRQHRMSFITGPPGIGKTPLIEEVLKNLVDRHKFHSVVRLHSSLRELAQFQPIPSKDGPQIVFVDLNREKRCSGYDCAEAMPKLREQDHVIFEGRISPPYPDDSLSIKLAPLTVPDRFRIARSLLPRANPATHILLGGIGGGNLELMHHLAAHFSQTQASEVEFEVEFVAEQIRSWLIRRYTIDQYRGLSDDERHLLYLLSVLRIPLSRDLITGTLANLFDVSIEQLISSLDGLLADGWLCTATSTHPELIMISPWLHPFLVPNDSETPQLHRTAVEILRAIPKSVNITSEISYHYEQAGDLFRAWAERMGALDSLRALSPKNAVLECEQLLKTLKAPTEGLELMGRTQVYCVLGHTWKHLDDMNSARACYEKVLQLEREATDANVSPNELRQIKRIAADAKLGLAEFALMAGVSSEAESYIQSAEKVYLEDGDPAALARSVLMLAYTAQRGGSNDAALENATRALRLAEEGNDLAAASDAQLYLGRFHLRVTGDNAKAKMHFAMAVEHAQKSINSLAEAESRLHLGQILCDEEDHSDAGVAMIEAAIDIYERLGARVGLAKASASLAQAHFKQGEIPDGADELLTAYRTFLELNEDEEATKLKEYLEMILAELQRLGQVFHKEADLYRAKKYFESALAIAGELQVLQDIDFADLRLGIISADEGRLEEAAERFAACRERGLATERWWLATEALHELGNIAIFQEKYDTARDLLEKCLQEKRTHRPESALGPTMHMLAVVCSQTGQFERSHSLLLECVERAEAEKDPLGRTSSMGALAEVLFKRGELEQAATMASECLTDARKFNMNDIVVVCLALLGMIASSKGDKDEAKQYWSEAFVLAKGIGHYAAKDLEKLLTNDSSADT